MAMSSSLSLLSRTCGLGIGWHPGEWRKLLSVLYNKLRLILVDGVPIAQDLEEIVDCRAVFLDRCDCTTSKTIFLQVC